MRIEDGDRGWRMRMADEVCGLLLVVALGVAVSGALYRYHISPFVPEATTSSRDRLLSVCAEQRQAQLIFSKKDT